MTEYRSYETEVELRSASKRLVCGLLVPYGIDKRIDADLVERFARGSGRHQLSSAHRVQLYNLHSNKPGNTLLGHGVELREVDRGLYGELRVTDGMLGDHYLNLAKDGTLHQWSIGFRPEREHDENGVTVRTKATVTEVAFVPEGAYGEDAVLEAVRSAALPKLRRDVLLAKLPRSYFPR